MNYSSLNQIDKLASNTNAGKCTLKWIWTKVTLTFLSLCGTLKYHALTS